MGWLVCVPLGRESNLMHRSNVQVCSREAKTGLKTALVGSGPSSLPRSPATQLQRPLVLTTAAVANPTTCHLSYDNPSLALPTNRNHPKLGKNYIYQKFGPSSRVKAQQARNLHMQFPFPTEVFPAGVLPFSPTERWDDEPSTARHSWTNLVSQTMSSAPRARWIRIPGVRLAASSRLWPSSPSQ